MLCLCHHPVPEVFGPHLHTCHPLAVGGCGLPCLPTGPTSPHHSPSIHAAQRCHNRGGSGDYCVPMRRTHAAKLARAEGHMSPVTAALSDWVPSGAVQVRGGAATATLPASRTVSHTKFSNPCHASCPLDADTQQRLGIENPVANTCKISINTGRQDKAAHGSRVARVVVGDTSSSSGDERPRTHRRGFRQPFSRGTQRRSGRTARHRPPPSSTSSSSSTPSPARRARPPARVPSSCRAGRHRVASNKSVPRPCSSSSLLDQPSCRNSSYLQRPVCKHVHSHPCRHQSLHPSVKLSSSCRRAAVPCSSRRHTHCSASQSRLRAADVIDAPPPMRDTCYRLPACPADRCPADASPVGVSTHLLNRRPVSCKGMENPCRRAEAAPSAARLASQPSPFHCEGRRVPTTSRGSYIRSHSSCPHVHSARCRASSRPPACSKPLPAYYLHAKAPVMDHDFCKGQGWKDPPYRHPASYKRFPSAPPFAGQITPPYGRRRFNQPHKRCPGVQQEYPQATVYRHHPNGKRCLPGGCSYFQHPHRAMNEDGMLYGIDGELISLPFPDGPPRNVFLTRP